MIYSTLNCIIYQKSLCIFEIYLNQDKNAKQLEIKHPLGSLICISSIRTLTSSWTAFYREDMHDGYCRHVGFRLICLLTTVELLRHDIKMEYYPLMYTPKRLWNARPEYKEFELKVFTQRIYQEIRRNKFNNWREQKREEKSKAHAEHRQDRDYSFE